MHDVKAVVDFLPLLFNPSKERKMIGCYTPTLVYIIIYVEVYVLVLTHIKDRQCVRLYFVVSKTNLGICYYVSNNHLSVARLDLLCPCSSI